MNSPVQKENSTKCVDTIVSKSISSPTQSSPTFLMDSCHLRDCYALEDHNTNLQDSGFFSVPSDDSTSLNGLNDSQNSIEKCNSPLDISQSDSYVSPSTVTNIDDSFLNNVSPARLSQDSLPPGFNTLIDGDIFKQNSPTTKPIVRRKNIRYSEATRKTDSIFEDIKNNDGCTKNRKLISEFECISDVSTTSKRIKPNVNLSIAFESPSLDSKNTNLTSTSEATIKAAFEKQDNNLNLIGDFSQSFILPLLSFGPHDDLRSISSETLAQLLEGTYNDCIGSYLIIDCRYPYEYEGGHINGAVNIFTKEQLLKDFNENRLGKKSLKTEDKNGKRNVLIFHCEFSSERGPNLSRYLRNADRHKNSTCYPYLDYPEMYLLDGGYCKFFSQYSHLCVPSSYRSMNDPDHTKDLKLFRSKSKTWEGHNDGVSRLAGKNVLKRLGFN